MMKNRKTIHEFHYDFLFFECTPVKIGVRWKTFWSALEKSKGITPFFILLQQLLFWAVRGCAC